MAEFVVVRCLECEGTERVALEEGENGLNPVPLCAGCLEAQFERCDEREGPCPG